MSSALEPQTLASSARETDQCVDLFDIGWKGYRQMLRLKGDRRYPRFIYLDGSLELVSPACSHENGGDLLDRLIKIITEEFRIPCIGTRSTTFRIRRKKGGIEPDLSYYLANALRIRGKTDIDLRIDPPPDLAIEVVNTRDASRALEVYRRFQVPEVWVWEHPTLRILVLGDDGHFSESPSSRAFPFLSAQQIAGWITKPRPETDTDTDWALEFRQWVRDVLIPRTQNPEPPS